MTALTSREKKQMERIFCEDFGMTTAQRNRQVKDIAARLHGWGARFEGGPFHGAAGLEKGVAHAFRVTMTRCIGDANTLAESIATTPTAAVPLARLADFLATGRLAWPGNKEKMQAHFGQTPGIPMTRDLARELGAFGKAPLIAGVMALGVLHNQMRLHLGIETGPRRLYAFAAAAETPAPTALPPLRDRVARQPGFGTRARRVFSLSKIA